MKLGKFGPKTTLEALDSTRALLMRRTRNEGLILFTRSTDNQLLANNCGKSAVEKTPTSHLSFRRRPGTSLRLNNLASREL